MELKEEDFAKSCQMIFCDDAKYRHPPCKQCGRELDRYLTRTYDKYGVYLCSMECWRKFMMDNACFFLLNVSNNPIFPFFWKRQNICYCTYIIHIDHEESLNTSLLSYRTVDNEIPQHYDYKKSFRNSEGRNVFL